MKNIITVPQIKAARALIGWSREELSQASGIPKITISRVETVATTPRASTLAAIRTALEAAGVEFIPENGGGAGVRMKKG